MAAMERSELLALLARALARAGSGEPLEVRLCRAYLSILGGTGAALTLAYTGPERVTLCATDEISARLEDLQDVLGEGPGPHAYRSGEFAVADLEAGESRWPLFTDAARRTVGPVLVYALPVYPHREILGVLTIYQHTRQVPERSSAQFLSDAIGAALIGDLATADGILQSSPWATRAQIHQATGMVVAQLRIDVDDAMALLRAHAYAHDTTMADVAAQITSRRLQFSDNAESENP